MDPSSFPSGSASLGEPHLATSTLQSPLIQPNGTPRPRPRYGLTVGGKFVQFPGWLSALVRVAVLLPVARIFRGKSLGVQVAVFDTDGKLLLVRQGYTPHWVFPGGGVDRGERLADAAVRELREEAGVSGVPLRFFGVYANFRALPDDHVAFFVGECVAGTGFPDPGFEIVDHGFFPTDNLPDNTAPSVQRRLAEIADGRQADRDW